MAMPCTAGKGGQDMAEVTLFERVAGSLVGGAAGDALGYPVEFLDADAIFREFGEAGITQYALAGDVACISDDTQMTLFTADGLLRAEERCVEPTPQDYVQGIYEGYRNWLCTQDEDERLPDDIAPSPLLRVAALRERRAPGNTCLSALRSGERGSLFNRLNNSKGCGGIMRIAPVPLLLSHRPRMSRADADMVAAQAAALTHGHPLGYMPAAFTAHVIGELMRGSALPAAVDDALQAVRLLFAEGAKRSYFAGLIGRAKELAADSAVCDDLDAIRELGGGWVAEETAAIAVYCALRHAGSFEDAIVAAVNHDGDSDSTGAVTGNIMGALLGIRAIPPKFTDALELKDVLLEYARRFSQDPQ